MVLNPIDFYPETELSRNFEDSSLSPPKKVCSGGSSYVTRRRNHYFLFKQHQGISTIDTKYP